MAREKRQFFAIAAWDSGVFPGFFAVRHALCAGLGTMTRNEPPFSPVRALRMIRLIPAPILAAIAGFAAMRALGFDGYWPELTGAIAGGYVLGVVARKSAARN
ncbi:hypothetical protein [Hyphobacterium sp.]|uniref:hypothetical protein n=1 Tax=Hyphobacterium sp. TaxID=2004662 RepID=UPI003BAD5AC4